MNLNLENQSVLITGSSSGIGRSIAEGFLEENARVILTGRNKRTLSSTADELIDKYIKENVFSFAGDLNDPNELKSIHQFILKEIGNIDHLICNVGSGKSVNVLDEDVTEFKRMLQINLLNTVGIVDELIPLLGQKPFKNHCHPSITFIGSICGIESIGCPVAYASAKSALISYAKNISFPLGRKGVRVNVVSPGNIMFPGSTWEQKIKENHKKVHEMLENNVPLKCFGDPKDVANVTTFLSSKRARFVNGVNWVVDGGQTRS